MKPEDMNFELLGPGVHTEGAGWGWEGRDGCFSC
jgi:hypothetical protein